LRAEHTGKQHKRNPSAGHGPSPSIPINVHRTRNDQSSSPTKANPIPEPKPQSPLFTEKHETAASAIQHKFRIHRSFQTVSNIASEFQTLKSAFVYPTVIDFQEPGTEEGHIISVSTTRAPSDFDKIEETGEDEETPMEVDGPQPKLAYTAANYPVHSYVDAMERLLMKLDGVESRGDKGVRERRRSVVREIGQESAKLERYWKQSWMDYVEKQKEAPEKEKEAQLEEKMEIDEELVHVEHLKGEDNRDDEWLDVAELAPVLANAHVEIGMEDRLISPAFTEVPKPSSPSTLSDEAEVIGS
jgi:hypothetical protein